MFGVWLNLASLHFRNIEDLTSQVNNLEIKVNDSELENEELRERLGMDPKETLNIEDVRHKKKVKAEQAVALNRALTKEVICTVDNTPIGGHLELVPAVHQSHFTVTLFCCLPMQVERLEEERLQLKRQLRKQALHRGAR